MPSVGDSLQDNFLGKHPINRASGFVPIYMSVIALLAVAKAVVNLEKYGPPMDEDGPWHVFMLMTLMQVPLICYFIFSSRREFHKALPTLATQVSLLSISVGAAHYFPGIY
jgi:hypothetical protein